MNTNDFGLKIKALRDSTNTSQEDLAYALNISQSKLSKIESGKVKKIDFILMNEICNYFSVNIEDMIYKRPKEIIWDISKYISIISYFDYINIL